MILLNIPFNILICIVWYNIDKGNNVKIIKKILNKVKTYISSSKPNKIVDSSKPNKQELKYNQHGFPSYRPIIKHDKESNKRHIKY